MSTRHVLFLAAALTTLSACSGGGSSAGGPPAPAGGKPTAAKSASVSLTISIPTKSAMAKSRPAFVSPNTQSLAAYTYAAGGSPPSTPTATANVGPGVTGCSTNSAGTAISCNVIMNLPTGSEELQLKAMSGTNGTGSVLASATQSITVTVGMQPIQVVLDGTPAIIRLSLETPVLALGTAGTSVLDVNAYDATGALIVAPGNFSTALAVTADSSSVSLSASSAAAPGTQITVTYAGSSGAPYAVHITASGGSIASNLIVGSTLDIDPPQSMVFLASPYDSNVSNVITMATTSFGLEPPQSYGTLLAGALGTNVETTESQAFALLPNGLYASSFQQILAPDSLQQCALTIWSSTPEVPPLSTTIYSSSSGSATCPIAADGSDLLVADNGGGGSEITEYSVSSSGTLTKTGTTIALTGSQMPDGVMFTPNIIATNAAGQIVLLGYAVTGNYPFYALRYTSVTATTPGSITLSSSASYNGAALDSSGGIYLLSTVFGTSAGYAVNEYSSSLMPTTTIYSTPAPPISANGQALAVDKVGDVYVSQNTLDETTYVYTSGIDVYATGATTLDRTVPLAYTISGNNTKLLGPIIASSPAPQPSGNPPASGDMLGYVAGRTWTYLITPSYGSPAYAGVYADPQLVNGNVRLVAFQSSSASNLFETANEVGSADFTPLSGSYLAAAYTSVSSGTDGVTTDIPGTPLFVPSSLLLNQTWNPFANTTLQGITGSVTAQVVATGSVSGESACPSGSATSGATVQYSANITGGGETGAFQLSFVPGCGMTAFQPPGGGYVVLQSVGSDSTLGQLTIPRGQPPIVAALHALWQRTFNVKPPSR